MIVLLSHLILTNALYNRVLMLTKSVSMILIRNLDRFVIFPGHLAGTKSHKILHTRITVVCKYIFRFLISLILQFAFVYLQANSGANGVLFRRCQSRQKYFHERPHADKSPRVISTRDK